MIHEVTVPWKPHAKQRPRVKNNIAYTPTATRDAEKAIRAAFIEASEHVGPLAGPIGVSITLLNDCFKIKFTETVEYTNRKLRGDVDNYAKCILDALNGVAYDDDSQITHLEMEKA
jgi:Holliday junction resolvase RusA-like endonuclease